MLLESLQDAVRIETGTAPAGLEIQMGVLARSVVDGAPYSLSENDNGILQFGCFHHVSKFVQASLA